ncbi:MAG: TonB-dependent receptor [Verrucomicrobiota bacterium]|jgi:Tfp pilus assembly protein PilF
MTPFFLKRTLAHALCLAVLTAGSSLLAQTPAPAATPGPRDAVLLTISGTVEVAPAGTTAFAPARPNQILHLGDQVRSGKASRASLRLSDKSVLRLYELTTLEIKPPQQAAHNDVIDVKSGATYFFNRDKPQETQFQTPSASGAIRGTEFNLVVREDGRTELTLLDGQVDLTNDQGSLQLQSGEQATVASGQAPQKTAVLNAVNVIQWTLYYPAILDPDELEMPAGLQTTLAPSLEAYRSGDLLQALAKYPADRTPASEAERVYRAALLLAVGEVDQAQALLRDSMTEARPAALAGALQEMIASVKGDPLTRTAPRTLATEWLAGSYAAQSHRDLPQSLDMARKAAAKSPNSGFALERVAEMEFSFGRTLPALDALRKSLALSPRNAQALALNGFVLSAQNKIAVARSYFEQAIAADGSLANGWLGRGLTKIKTADVDGGRKDLETAAALEPTRAFLRSYLGKAWSMDQPFQYTWNSQLATKELALAMKLDPNDPTAWLYSALLNDQRDAINQAISDLEHSQDLNANRSLFRSKFLLDQDQAVRSANLALIYQDAGFTDVAVREGTKAVEDDYANYAAHLFLSDSYYGLLDPKKSNLRYESAWEDELLLADILAPVGAGVLSQTVSQQEYSRMFEADRLGINSDTTYWSRGAWLQNASQYGTVENFAYSLDGYYYTDPGFRRNNDFDNSDFSATVKYQITPKDTAFFQVERTELHSGDVNQYYNQNSADTTFRQQEIQDPNLLLGFHHSWSPGNDTIFLYRNLHDTSIFSDPAFPIPTVTIAGTGVESYTSYPYPAGYQDQQHLNSLELQHIFQTESQRLILGSRYQNEDHSTENSGTTPTFAGPPLLSANLNTEFERFTAYAYYQLKLFDALRLTAGAAYDQIRFPTGIVQAPITSGEEDRERVSPKLGLDWTPWERTRFRVAYTRSVAGLFNDSATSIEPSEVAGFNQAFRSLTPLATVPGTVFETTAIGFDHEFPTRTYLNAEAGLRNSDSDQIIGIAEGQPLPTGILSQKQEINFKEKYLALNINQLVGPDFSFGAGYSLDSAEIAYDNQILGLPAGFTGTQFKINNAATLHQFTLFGNYYLPCGFFSQVQANWFAQSDKGFAVNEPGDAFWQFNLFAGYRFPKRHMELQVGVLNLANQDYRLDPLTYYIDPCRTRSFYTSFKFNF